MKFEWDEAKNNLNFKKHRVWFEEAQTIWADVHAAEFYDPDHSNEEDRFIRIGLSTGKKLLLVVFCERSKGNLIRIVSARKTTKKEQRDYEEGI